MYLRVVQPELRQPRFVRGGLVTVPGTVAAPVLHGLGPKRDLPAFLGAVFLQRLACRRFPGPALARAAPAALRVLWFRRALRRALLRVLRQVALRQRGVKGSQPA